MQDARSQHLSVKIKLPLALPLLAL